MFQYPEAYRKKYPWLYFIFCLNCIDLHSIIFVFPSTKKVLRCFNVSHPWLSAAPHSKVARVHLLLHPTPSKKKVSQRAENQVWATQCMTEGDLVEYGLAAALLLLSPAPGWRAKPGQPILVSVPKSEFARYNFMSDFTRPWPYS